MILSKPLATSRWRFLGTSAVLILWATGCGPLSSEEPSLKTQTAALVNECTAGTANCDPNATCTDTPDSFTCTCNADFAGDGVSCTRVSYTVALEAVADAQVSSSAPTTNYGTAAQFEVNRGTSEAYLRFDLHSLPAGARVKSVTLTATAYSGYAYGGDGNVYTTFVPDDSWGESTINWNNRPASSGSALGAWFLWYDSTPVDKVGINSSPDLVPVVQTELAGDGLVSFRLNSPGYLTRYRSREYSNLSQRPQLLVTFDFVKVLEPEADSYTTTGFWEEDTNFGAQEDLEVSIWFQKDTYLRFNLGSLPAGAKINAVKLSATAYQGYSADGDGNVYTYLVPDNSWGEYTITFNNRPAGSGAPLGSWFLWYPSSDTIEDKVGENADPSLIPVVQSASDASDRRISFLLHNPGYYTTTYHSRETADATKRPKLEVSYLAPFKVALTPSADAYVSSGAPTTNFGTSTTLTVNSGATRTYLRFDLPNVLRSQLTGATLSMTAYSGYAYGGDGNVYTTFVPTDSWGETTITWNNRPATSGSALGAWFLWYDYTPVEKVGINSDPSLLPVLSTELAGDRKISFELNSPSYLTNYDSREYSDPAKRPHLELTFE